VDRIDAFFDAGGTLARAHPLYERRPGQHEMARLVEGVLRDGGRAMIEAGTGTGKTLAYLVPALDCGRRVVVSTGTRNLQDQIADNDLPFLRDRCGLPVSACVMKGRENYLCRYRLAQLEAEPLLEDLAEQEWLPRIAAWSRATTTGDRAELSDMPDALKLWRDVNARAETCGGVRCPEFERCWLTALKRRAQSAQLVIVNHHLFFADLAVRSAYGAVLPDYDSVIFDEGHLLEEIATLYFGAQVSSAQIEDVARQAEQLAARHGGPAKQGGGAAELRQAAWELFAPLRSELGEARGRLRFEPVSRGGPDLDVAWRRMGAALDEVLRAMPDAAGAAEGTESLPRRVDDVRAALTRVLARDDPAFVYGIEARGRASVVLSAAPIDVSAALREALFDRLHAAVLTSATLAVGGRFDFFRERLGLGEPATASIDSAFDHARQALLYLPQDMPEPKDERFLERAVAEIERLVEVTDGRAFLLFTSFANLNRVRDALARCARWPLLVQGEGSKAGLLDAFRSTPRAVLLGSTSFWHGVDVPGEALSLVVVDKLPFDVPDDPLIGARIRRLREQRKDPFLEYQVPLAVLELKQGLGRLLRSSSDRGILSVLDPRLTTRRYGKLFLGSLPPYRIVRDFAECAAFFGGPCASA
jgi:ATP-dependent DNA helicase DinG